MEIQKKKINVLLTVLVGKSNLTPFFKWKGATTSTKRQLFEALIVYLPICNSIHNTSIAILGNIFILSAAYCNFFEYFRRKNELLFSMRRSDYRSLEHSKGKTVDEKNTA